MLYLIIITKTVCTKDNMLNANPLVLLHIFFPVLLSLSYPIVVWNDVACSSYTDGPLTSYTVCYWPERKLVVIVMNYLL